jgi:hypothetical protein
MIDQTLDPTPEDNGKVGPLLEAVDDTEDDETKQMKTVLERT